MIKLGDYNELEVVREAAKIGYYLNGGTNRTTDDILLPEGNLNGNKVEISDKVNAFIYRDSRDRLIATLKEPKAKVSDLAMLEIVSVTDIGAFADFGLERDIFIPLKEQKYKLEEGKKYLLYIYVDKTGRLAATTDIDRYMLSMEEFEEVTLNDSVKGVIYGFQTNNSLMVAIDNKYKGVVLFNEYFTKVNIGDEISCRVKKIYEDGMIGLTPRKNKLDERELLEDKILNYLKENGGSMKFNDKSNPEDIKRTFNSSKNYFKIALGGLMKQKLITQDESGTKLI